MEAVHWLIKGSWMEMMAADWLIALAFQVPPIDLLHRLTAFFPFFANASILHCLHLP